MKAGTEDKRKRIVAGVLGLLALLAVYPLYEDFFGGGSTPPPAPAIVVSAPAVKTVQPDRAVSTPPGNAAGGTAEAKTLGTTSAALDPKLHMDAMMVTESVAYEGSGRNIFSAISAPVVVIPKVVAPIRVVAAVAPPPVIRDPGPPPPPPIDLKFCGYFVSPASGAKQAVLLHGEDVFLASAGDIVMRRYRVVSISPNSVQVEDMPNNNKQSLPLLAN
jgi:hypothetical protein